MRTVFTPYGLILIFVFALSGCATSSENKSTNEQISPDQVQAAIVLHKDEFESCIRNNLDQDESSPVFKLVIAFVIEPSGVVSSANISGNTIKNQSLQECLVQVVKEIRFPKSSNKIKVSYPFKFKK